MKSILLLVLPSILFTSASCAAKLKKIEIVETNNRPFFSYKTADIYKKPNNARLIHLKKYLQKKNFNYRGDNELKFVTRSLAWVTDQWKHDGVNQPPKDFDALKILKSVHENSQRYRCVEYGLVLTEVLQTAGFITRSLSMRSSNVAYGGFGQGHVAMEVWLNSYNKWVFLDPQFGTFLTSRNGKVPLSFYEIFKEKKSGKWNSLNITFVAKNYEDMSEGKYKDFLKDYFGHMSVSAGANAPKISLFLESEKPVLTFQGQNFNNAIFTDDPRLVYPPINRTSLLFSYKNEISNFQAMLKKHEIKTEQDYIKKMHYFSAKPDFKIKLRNNMPNFSYYEYRTNSNSPWKKVPSDEVFWSATAGKNRIEARSVNSFGRPGPVTYSDIAYR